MENLKALTYGRKLNCYQRMLAQQEFEKMIARVSYLENQNKKAEEEIKDLEWQLNNPEL